MSMVDWLRKMRDAGFSPEQAEAIASVPEDRFVTREYCDAQFQIVDSRFRALDARLEALERRITDTLTMRMLGLSGLVILAVGLHDKFVRP